jgi:hypothetical protein
MRGRGSSARETKKMLNTFYMSTSDISEACGACIIAGTKYVYPLVNIKDKQLEAIRFILKHPVMIVDIRTGFGKGPSYTSC